MLERFISSTYSRAPLLQWDPGEDLKALQRQHLLSTQALKTKGHFRDAALTQTNGNLSSYLKQSDNSSYLFCSLYDPILVQNQFCGAELVFVFLLSQANIQNGANNPGKALSLECKALELPAYKSQRDHRFPQSWNRVPFGWHRPGPFQPEGGVQVGGCSPVLSRDPCSPGWLSVGCQPWWLPLHLSFVQKFAPGNIKHVYEFSSVQIPSS